MNRYTFLARKRVFFRSPILLAGVILAATLISLVMFYETLIRLHEGYLFNEVTEQLNWLEMMGQMNDWDSEKTLKQFIEFNKKNPPLSATSECLLAFQKDDEIHYLFQQNSSDVYLKLPAAYLSPSDPVWQAMSGNVGTMIGTDYRGHKVLAAFNHVPHLNWGIVYKVDLKEIISPFLISTAIISITVLVLIVGGILVVVFLGRPLIRELEQSRERLSLVIQGTRNGIWDWPDVEDDVLWWSGRFDEILGYEADELSPSLSLFQSLLHPDDLPAATDAVNAHLKQRVPLEVECRLRTKSGEYRWYRIRGQALWGENGASTRMSGSLEDIQLQKRAEQIRTRSICRLKTINRLLETLLLPEPLEQKCKRIVEFAVESLNLDFCCIWLVRESDLCKAGCGHATGKDGLHQCTEHEQCLHLVATAGRYTNLNGDHRRIPSHGCAISRIASGAESKYLTNNMVRDAELAFPEWARSLGLVSSAGYKVRNGNGEPIGVLAGFSKNPMDTEDDTFLLSLTEITSMVILGNEAAETLRQALISADAATRAKSEFLANMSHEIRTPMTAILGFTDVLLGNPSSTETAESAQIIKRNGEHLLRIINDILDLSKIESGVCQIEKIACSPRQILGDVVATMKVRADTKGISCVSEISPDVPNCLVTDPLRLRQILVNLIGNAVKFTEVGGVKVVMWMESDESKGNKLRVDVTDTGIGLTEEQIGLIFQPFSQADGSVSRRFGGTGLGLAISLRLAKMLGGMIHVSSVLGKGSTFQLTVAAASLGGDPIVDLPSAAPAVPAEPVSLPILSGTVLLAEDGPDNQRLISHLLQKAGIKVQAAKNGKDAFDLAMEAKQAGSPYDAILMDMQMPIMDGYEATRHLRTAGYTGPIIALTAHAMADDRKKCLDSGCDDYITKPIDRSDLLNMIAKIMHNPSAPQKVPASQA